MAGNPEEFIAVNGALNLKPSFGPIPADQIIPWSVIVLANILIANRLLGLSWIITILSTGWGIATWWILTGSDASRFLSKFHAPPVWLYGGVTYYSLVNPAPVEPEVAQGKQRRRRLRKPRRINT